MWGGDHQLQVEGVACVMTWERDEKGLNLLRYRMESGIYFRDNGKLEKLLYDQPRVSESLLWL